MTPLAQSDLPEPPPYSARNVLRVIGPGAILLAGGIGGGEWLVGPAIGVQYGLGLFWIATVAVSLQVVFNLEAIRYTLSTGEPIITGFMRLKPSSRFWGTLYAALTAAQLGLPSVVGGCAAVLFAAFAGRMPETSDVSVVTRIGCLVILGPLAILLFGRTIERMLERFSWVMIAVIFSFLLAVNVLFVPLSHWGATLAGFFGIGQVAEGVNLPLLAALAATAGSGGLANLAVSNWARDKGLGMGAKTGAISGAVGHRRITLTATG